MENKGRIILGTPEKRRGVVLGKPNPTEKGIRLGKPEKWPNPNFRGDFFDDGFIAKIERIAREDPGNSNPDIARNNLQRLKLGMRQIEADIVQNGWKPSSSINQQYTTLAVQVRVIGEILSRLKK